MIHGCYVAFISAQIMLVLSKEFFEIQLSLRDDLMTTF